VDRDLFDRMLPSIRIFDEDDPTPEGTCVRDDIHVQDLAQAHSPTPIPSPRHYRSAGSDHGKPRIIKRKHQKLGANSALDTGFWGQKQAAKGQRADYGVRELAPALRQSTPTPRARISSILEGVSAARGCHAAA